MSLQTVLAHKNARARVPACQSGHALGDGFILCVLSLAKDKVESYTMEFAAGTWARCPREID